MNRHPLLLILLILPLQCLTAQNWRSMFKTEIKGWNCYTNATGFPIDLEEMSGYWYEAARVPNQHVLECLNVSVPANLTENKEYELKLSYISTVNGQWQPTQETVSFPWDENTQNGIFDLSYSNDFINVKVTYKLAYVDYKSIIVLCGYAGISPVPLFKLFTRDREINPRMKQIIEIVLAKYNLESQVIWTSQAMDSCNSGERLRSPQILFSGLLSWILFISWSRLSSVN